MNDLREALTGMLSHFDKPHREEWLNDSAWKNACAACEAAHAALAAPESVSEVEPLSNAELLDFARLVLSGLKRGNIKSKPIIIIDLNEESVEILSMEDIARTLIEKLKVPE